MSLKPAPFNLGQSLNEAVTCSAQGKLARGGEDL